MSGCGLNFRSLLRMVSFAAMCLVAAGAVRADSEPITIISQTISAEFFPIEAFVLLESSEGEVRQYPAEAVLRSPSVSRGDKTRLFVGAAVPRSVLPPGERSPHYTFFLIGEESKFAATAVQQWSSEGTEQELNSIGALEDRVKQDLAEVRMMEVEIKEVSEKLETLREEASRAAAVDEIVDLKMQIAVFEGGGEDNAEERQRLADLVALGRRMEEPEAINDQLKELSEQLMQTAQATAMADQLNNRRKEAAKASLARKLNLIREMKNIDETLLARNVLALRERRRQLESRLHIAGEDGSSDFQ